MSSYYIDTYAVRKKRRQLKNKVTFYVLGIAISILLAFILTRFFVFGIVMRGDSMKPTIENRQICISNRLSYKIGNPKRDDIIVFKASAESKIYYIKRVIAVPGDTVWIKDGKILVNNKEIKKYSDEDILSEGLATNKITLGKDQYFVLGDNYNSGEDSRVASIGNVKKENILGKVIFS